MTTNANTEGGQSSPSHRRPKVLIVGAGLGGLTLGMLLQKADIPYEIYERAMQVKPLGSAMYFNGTSAPLFKQCGFYDEFVSFSKYVSGIQVCNEKCGIEYIMDFTGERERFGADGYIVARPKLYDLLLRQVPKEKVHLGRKFVSVDQDDNSVVLHFSDGSVVQGDILVGADGAYSAVRKDLYSKLDKEQKLPPPDALPLPFSVVCLLGQTRPLTAEEFPDVALGECQFRNTLGDNQPYSWSTFTTRQNTVCWAVYKYLENEVSKDDDTYRDVGWGSQAAGAMADLVRDCPIISGEGRNLTMGDLIDWTPKEYLSKVMLEEKVFETWFDGRTALIGDACHKLNPAGGAGAVNAMHDAIVVANWINALPFYPTTKDINEAFKAYQDERMPWVKEAFESSKMFKIMGEKTFMAKVVRYCSKNMPVWLWRRMQVRMMSNRLQCAFLPLSEDKGTSRPAHQPSLFTKAPEADGTPTVAV
ncbi:hypothetical protein BGX33_008652 [Mortierella sp. NVP41]|nr:hypothetical protein BGX33_008652 [Mortierella sp. NVP41]